MKRSTRITNIRIKNHLLAVLTLASVFLGACKKESAQIGEDTGSLETVSVPDAFSWETSRDVTFNIGVSDTRFQNAIHLISIYDGDPSNGGAIISKGAASLVSAFNVKVSLPSVLSSVYIVKTAPDGSVVSKKVDVTSNTVSLSVGQEGFSSAVMSAGKDGSASLTGTTFSTGEDCNTGCTTTVTNTDYNINVNSSNEVICITGSNITVGINANGGTVRVCGSNVTITNANLNNFARLIVTSSGSVTFSNLNLNGSSSSFENNGTVTVNGTFSPGGIVTNNGTLTVNGDLNLNAGTTFTNNGVISVSSSMSINTNNVSLNSGKIVTNGDFKLNGSARFVNNCSLWTKKQFQNNGEMKNYNLIKADDETVINGGASTLLYNGSMLKTTNLTLNGTISGSGTSSLIKVSNRTTINGGGQVSGAIQYCDQNGIETNYGNFVNGAVQACSLYVPVTDCNTEGNGTAPVVDSDGDGVADALDAWPNDATRAFNNYYPSATKNTASTLAFEDNWPSKGDYDMNDVVISYRYLVITNAQNKVTHVEATYNLIASGGDLHNGFGVEFPLNRSDISNLTGATLEEGQSKAVIILFSNTRAEQAEWNTVRGKTMSPVKSYIVTFDVKSNPLISSFSLGTYNPFIWNNSAGRGYETHLPGKTPTMLANTSLFGTADDKSGNGKYYVTEKNLPWAIDIPMSSFNYPIEGTDIAKAYPNFIKWAGSAGVDFKDWYSNTSQGYRNTSNLFIP